MKSRNMRYGDSDMPSAINNLGDLLYSWQLQIKKYRACMLSRPAYFSRQDKNHKLFPFAFRLDRFLICV
jgi:hypothetical protein